MIPNHNKQCSKKFWKITLTSTLHDKRAARQSVVAEGSVIGEAAYATVGIFSYRGGPKGFKRKNVDIVYINETFTLDRCCGIIGRANGFGMYDRFSTKKDALSKLISNQNSSHRHLFSLPLAQMILHSVVILYVAWMDREIAIEWPCRSGLKQWNKWPLKSLFLIQLSIVM